MGRQVFKQPNGKFGIWSYVVDCPIYWNLNKEDYIKIRLDEAKSEIEKDANDIFENEWYPYLIKDFDSEQKGKMIHNMDKREMDEFLYQIGSKLTSKDFTFPDDFVGD